ncbi:MAG: hypothetical protein ABI036_12475 [Fibrobacteria bacterium]
MIRICPANRYLALFCAGWLGSIPTLLHAEAASQEPDTSTFDMPAGDVLESKVRSTLLYGGSSPVSFSGEGRLRLQMHDYSKYPAYLAKDQTWTQANWEGNESMIRLGMVVHASRNAVLWSKIGFQNTLPGIYVNNLPAARDSLGFTREQNRHDKSDLTANIQEDMAAGLAIRTVPASFWLRMGNIMWTEASPLTVWKDQPRTFAWDYLPFEVEQPVARYYEYNIAKGEKSGRAAWNKKAFNGVDFSSIDLPLRLQVNLMYAAFERYDNFEREYIDYSNDLGIADLSNDAKQVGIGDSFRHMYHGRIAQERFFGSNLTLGLNLVGIVYKNDIIANDLWIKNFDFKSTIFRDSTTLIAHTYQIGQGFYKEPKVLSLDLRGAINDKLEVHFDAAVSVMDTVWMRYGVDSTSTDRAAPKSFTGRANRETARADPAPALFARFRSKYGLPVQADIAYIAKGFYSPFSFATPVDAFFPYGSNMVGAGKFIARGEGSPYTQNMAGVNLSVAPNVGYGHLRMAYGQHFQPNKARDLLFFPYRLNGQDYNSTFQSSYNRWGNDLVDPSLPADYNARLGDESFHTKAFNPRPPAPGTESGGLHSDYLSMFESFVPYERAAQADSNSFQTTDIMTQSQFVPQHQKWTYNLELDGAWDLGPTLGYAHDLFVSGYCALNGIASELTAISLNPKDMMLWGLYARAEPAIALNEKFYVLGLVGYENWRSDMAYMALKDETGAAVATRVPIDYKDYAWGLGFDWDFASRVGLHGRYKQMWHTDKFYDANDWTNTLVSAEIKMWF